MRCSKCGSDNRETRKFCAQCGTPLAMKCPRCGASNEPGEKFCGDCGAALATAQPRADQSPSVASVSPDIRIAAEQADASLDGERKTVTALFADIKGSMDLMENLDPEEARTLVDPALKLMIDAVHHYGGYVAQSTGDGIFALFGAPTAHEDHPQRALYAGLRLQDEMRRYSAKLRAAGKLPIEARVGVNTGEVVVRSLATGEGHAEYTPIGHSISLAARMQVLSPSGSIATTDATRKLCEGYFTFKSLGPTVVKGVSEPVEVYEVTGFGLLRTRLQRAAGRGLTRFVGRQREMEALKHAAEQAKVGHGQIVAAVAEPGVGKSRLFYEFKAICQADWMVLEAFSVSYGRASAYLPVIDLLHGYFRIVGEDDARARREKVTGRLLTLDRTQEDALPYLFRLLGIVEEGDPLEQVDAQVRRRHTHNAIKRILLRESLNQPLMLMFEDLHWIDDQTQALLNLLADSIANTRILLLVNYRPEYQHEWGSRSFYTQLRLDPLGRESAKEMLSVLLGDAPELDAMKRTIIQRTEGNPFFMEELAQALFDTGVLVRNGAVKVARSLAQAQIPPTMQGILASRVDRLPSDEKELLQMLAVIGREFPLRLIRAVTGLPDDHLERILSHLRLGEFIYEQPAFPDVEYTFKHALTQEVAYNSVLVERRKLLHERAGGAIETLFAEQLDEHLNELARHYGRSPNLAKAVKYLQLAGQQAAHRSAYAEAIAHLTSGLELLRNLPDDIDRARQELKIQRSLAQSLRWTKFGSPETAHALIRARELCGQAGASAEVFAVLQGLQWHHLIRLDLKPARELGEELLAMAEGVGEPAKLMAAHAALGAVLLLSGEFAAAGEHFEQTSSRSDWRQTDFFDFVYPSFGPWALWALGYADQALKSSREELALVEASSHPALLANALHVAAILHMYLREPRIAQERAEALTALASEYGFSYELLYGNFTRGWALAQQGQLEEGIAQMRRAATAGEESGVAARPRLFAQLAEACAKSEGPGTGLKLVAEGLDLIEHSGERMYEAELRRVRGELLAKQDPGKAVEAEQSIRTAIEVARLQGGKSLELRATTSLAQLLAKQGRREEARAMLAEIYNWFTEGFETADLKDAKALLDDLGA